MSDENYWAMFAAAALGAGEHYEKAASTATCLLTQMKKRFPDPEPNDAPCWINWRGGVSPVAGHIDVCVSLRDGSFLTEKAHNIEWGWDEPPHKGDVFSYLVLNP